MAKLRSISHWTHDDLYLSDDEPVNVFHYVHRVDGMRHDHDFWELVLVLGGSCIQEETPQHRELVPGDCVVLRPGAFHSYRECRRLEIISCAIHPALLQRELSWLQEDASIAAILRPSSELMPTTPRVIPIAPESLARCRSLLEPMMSDNVRPDRHLSKAGMIGRLLAVLAECAAAWVAAQGEPPPVPTSVRIAAALLEADPGRDWTMAYLARESSSSPSHLSRQFSAIIGQPPMTYLARLRAEQAAAILRRTELSVQAVGERVGYRRLDHFISRFRAFMGVPPGVYRAKFRGRADAQERR